MDDEEQKYLEVLENLENNLKPRNFRDPHTLIEKYGKDIKDDYTFMIITASIIIEHEINYHLKDSYNQELEPIVEDIANLEKKYGLDEDSYRPDDAPDDIKALNKQFDEVLDRKLIQLFKKYELEDFAVSYAENKAEFLQRFYNIKDRVKSKKGDSVLAIIQTLEGESSDCAKIQSYNAASILIASAIEGVLYYACSGNTAFIKELIGHNKRYHKDKSTAQLTFNELMSLAEKAGLLQSVQVPDIKKLLELVNNIRNLIHPGRRLSADYPNIGEHEYLFIYGIFKELRKTYIPN